MGRWRQMAATTILGLVAGAGIVPLLDLDNGSGSSGEPASSATPVVQVPSTSVVEVTLPPVEIPELAPEIGRVLVGSGFAERIDPESLEEQLTPEVIRVLIAKGIALPVFEPTEQG